jgi:hypothetical protein
MKNVIFFDNPQYLNINRSRLNTINIELKDTQNEYIQFMINFLIFFYRFILNLSNESRSGVH